MHRWDYLFIARASRPNNFNLPSSIFDHTTAHWAITVPVSDRHLAGLNAASE